MKRNLKKVALFGALSLSLLAGCAKNKEPDNKVDFARIKAEQDFKNIVHSSSDDVIITYYNQKLDLKDNDIVNIPEDYIPYVKVATNMNKETFTVNELNRILTLNLIVTDSDLSWVNYCTNLRVLDLNYVSNTDVSRYIKELPLLDTCTIYSASSDLIDVNEDYFKFLKNAKTLNLINQVKIDEDYISKTNIKELSVVSSFKSKINYKKLTNLDLLKIDTDDLHPYNSAIYFTTEDKEYLNKSGVAIEVGEEVLRINKQLDEINASLGIDENDSDYKKYEKIIVYVLNKINYGDTDKKDEYYENGFLNAALNGDEGVCGNYAALVEALCLRNGLECYILSSDSHGKHAWNLVNINDLYMYSDMTVLDVYIGRKNNVDVEYIEDYRNIIGLYPVMFGDISDYGETYNDKEFPQEYVEYLNRKSSENTKPTNKMILLP